MTAVLLAAAVVVGVPWPVTGLLAVGAAGTRPALAATAAIAVWAAVTQDRRDTTEEEAVWLGGVAAELRAGASLRGALIAAADRVRWIDTAHVVRLAEAGAPHGMLAVAIQAALPGRALVAPTLRIAGVSGGRAAAVFDRLAARVWEDVGAARHHRTLTAQARLSAWVVGGLPMLGTLVLAATGGLAAVVAAGPAGVAVMATGLVLETAGIAGVVVLLRRVPR